MYKYSDYKLKLLLSFKLSCDIIKIGGAIMYLSSNQHDQLQTIVTGFEIPFRTYIAIKLTDQYPTENDFTNIINTKTIPYTNSVYTMINSELGKIKANPTATYNQLTNTKNVKEKRIAETEIDVPNVARLISLTIIFKELFQDLLLSFRDENLYLQQAIIYKYVRNKLDHRGCKTLETYDMTMSLDFMSNSLICLKEDESIFWEKSSQVISKEIISLQTSSVNIPIEINNISSMPFPDMKIVCRNKEISEIKEFIYGKPYSFRKPSSLVLYGYGGVGKTALVLESIKQLVQDLQDNTTINNYKPDFLLFFTAKEEILNFSNTTGKIERLPNRYTFNTANSLINLIYKELSVEDFYNFNKTGLIIIDNLETLSLEDRKTIEDFVCYNSPPQIQYIITSRNEENFECRKKVGGFDDDVSGRAFIMDYIDENNFDVKLSDDEIRTLLQISMGNTLVLVLCLRRLSLKLTTMDGLVSDTTSPTYISHLKKKSKAFQQTDLQL